MVLDNHGELLQKAEYNDSVDKEVKVRQRKAPSARTNSNDERTGGKHKKTDSKARAVEFQTEHFGKLKTLRTCFGGERVKCHLCGHLVSITLVEAHASTCSKSESTILEQSLRIG